MIKKNYTFAECIKVAAMCQIENKNTVINNKVSELAIIICSIKPERCEETLKNIAETIGIGYQTIVFDNREHQWGICKVYNHCAKNTTLPYLCFMHEDVLFGTNNWGKLMVDFMKITSKCGVIGFAGGLQAQRNLSGWWSGEKRINVVEGRTEKNTDCRKLDYKNHLYFNPDNEKISEVVCIDGLFHLVKRSIWEEKRFDDINFTGFHFYDVDFSLSVAQKYKNYVFLNIDVFHDSQGDINTEYVKNMWIFQHKWNGILPYHLKSKSKFQLLRSELRETVSINAYCKKLSIKQIEYFKHLCKINSVGFILLAGCYLVYKRLLEKTINIRTKINAKA